MISPKVLRPFETLVLGLFFALAFRFPGALGGWLEPVLAFLFPLLLLEAVFRGRRLGWTYLALFLGLVGIFHWVPHTLESKGGLPFWASLLGGGLFYAWEALGFLGVVFLSRASGRRSGPLGAALGAALGILLWESFGFHIYQWSWGSPLGALPWTARSAAFLGTYGLSALLWGCAAGTAAALVQERRRWVGPSVLLGALVLLPAAWSLLPREGARSLDVVMVQPNWEPGVRQPGMLEAMWRLSDRALREHGLPSPSRPTLLLWPESSVLGTNHLLPDPRLQIEVRRRGLACLFGTEGGAPGGRYLTYNLVRGEAPGLPSFIQAKAEPMPFGERMPGPRVLREALDRRLGFVSQEPGELGPGSAFRLATPQGDLAVHPLICSEALMPLRVRRGVELTGARLLTNHTNDGWFDDSAATDLHAVQIRLRAVEMGMPLLRATLTGKSGLYREDGGGGLWGRPMTEATYAFTLDWMPIRTPARSPWVFRALLLALSLSTAWACFLPRKAP